MKIAIVAGEPSGDLLAAGLMQQLKLQSKKPIEFIGIGGPLMVAVGLNSMYPMNILTVGGFGLELICRIPKILSIRSKIIKQFIKESVDLFIGIDAPDFNFYVEKHLKAHGIKTVHYVSPTIWAWRYERIFKIKQATDLMLCIFPMEPALYAKEQIPAKFIGHPLADNSEIDVDTNFYKQRLQLTGTVFTILVGSRNLEIKYLGKIFIQACNLIAKVVPDATFIFPLVNQETATLFTKLLQTTKIEFTYKLFINQSSDAIKAADLVLAKSGTVTLEVALAKKPMIVSYKIGRLTAWIIRNKIKIPYVSMPNIILNKAVIPELLQNQATAANLAREFINLYNDKAEQQKMVNEFYHLHRQLKHDASKLAAELLLTSMQR